MGSLFLVTCRMLEVMEHLTTVLEELECENLNVAQVKQFSKETLLKPFALQTNVTSAKSSVGVVLVLVLVPSC